MGWTHTPSRNSGLQETFAVPGSDVVLDLRKPEDFQDFVLYTFGTNGLEDQANFARRVVGGESSFNQNVGPVDEPAGGRSHGPWMLYEQGLLPEFTEWAVQANENPNPYDPVSSTRFVAWYINTNGPEGWTNWSVAKNIIGQEGPEAIGSEAIIRQTGGGRTQFESEAARDFAAALLAQEQAEDTRLTRPLAFEAEARAQQEAMDVRRQNAITALLNAAPHMVPPDMEYMPGREPFGAGAQLGRMLGVNVPPQRMARTTLPIDAMLNAPNALDPQRVLALQRGR